MMEVAAAEAEIMVHELTSIKKVDLRNFDRGSPRPAGCEKRARIICWPPLAPPAHAFIAQSFAGWPYARAGGSVKTEEEPLDPEPPAAFAALEAIRYLGSAVIRETGLEGLVLRYGTFYGPGTAISEHGWTVNDVRNRHPHR